MIPRAFTPQTKEATMERRTPTDRAERRHRLAFRRYRRASARLFLNRAVGLHRRYLADSPRVFSPPGVGLLDNQHFVEVIYPAVVPADPQGTAS